MMQLGEARAVSSLTRFTAFISILGCLVVAHQCYLLKKQKKLTHMDRLILVLCLVDLGLAIVWFVGDWVGRHDFLCDFQGFWIQALGLMDILWTDAIAFHIYCLIVLNFTFKKAEKMFKYYLIITITTSLFLAVCLWLGGTYSFTSLWCWIENWNLKFYCFYSFVMATALFIAYVHVRVSRVISRDFKTLLNKGYKKDLVHINNKVTQVLIIFLITHFFGLLNRAVESGLGQTCTATAVLQAMLMPLRGFLNSLVYGLRGRKPPLCCLVLARRFPCIGKIFFFEDDIRDDVDSYGIDLTRLTPKYKEVAIFTSTFNLGECDLASIGDVGQWVPHGYEVYVIGLQECLCLEELQAALHKHLGGPKRYHMFKQAIGSKQTKLGFHGMIALTIFARTEDVRNGCFVPYDGANAQVKQGVNLGVVKAANKGAVGMGFRYYDTSIGFMTCHFASDSKGKSKIAKRNADAFNTLREAVLVAENAGFDAHLQHHHTIILGDMNYRVCQPPRLILEMVAWAAIQEKERAGANWRVARYKEFFPDAHGHLPIYVPEPAHARNGWKTLLSFDELTQMLANNIVFSGFEEPKIRFPPSYRRKRGGEGECGDYSDTARMAAAFTTQIALEGEAEATGVRPPSYTDRILSFSLEDKKDFLRQGPYDLCDAVTGSDHRPVSAVYFLKVNSAMYGPSSIGDLIPMKLRIQDVKVEFTKAMMPSLFDASTGDKEPLDPMRLEEGGESSTVSNSSATSSSSPDAQQMAEGGGKKGGKGAKASGPWVQPKSHSIDTVIITFPLPAEDPLIHQRKAAELAKALGNNESEGLSNMSTFQYDRSLLTGMDVVGKTRPELGLHALIKFCNVHNEDLGQGVICLPDPGNRILELAVNTTLTLGGTLRGKLTCKAIIEQIDFTAALSKPQTRSAAAAAGGQVASYV